ncbi:MAG: response regulator transcription factor [Thermomicrobiales bacterium]|nr:response regulator transcription factor [Thermomicrobiales bacterium]
MAAHILVVDDDEQIRTPLRRLLALEGFSVATAANGDDALRQAGDRFPDLVVLDVMMPGLDGIEVCRRLRASDPRLCIIMLTARDAVPDRVLGLETGADDYVIKPFAFAELLARVRGCLRRREGNTQSELRFADLRMDPGTREITRGNRQISLTTTEFELLRLFLQNPRLVLSRDRIYEGVWGYEFEGESKVIEVYISQLRQKLEAGGEPRLIHTIRGAGYALREEG